MCTVRNLPLVLVVLLSLAVNEAISCNGYNLKVNSIKNCLTGNIIEVSENFNAVLDKSCNVIPNGCATISKPFKSLSLKYTMNKPPMPKIEGTVDACTLVEQRKMAAQLLGAFAFPTKCPVKAQKLCVTGDKKFNIGKYRTQLGFIAGNIKLKLEGDHDSGKTCIELDMTIKK